MCILSSSSKSLKASHQRGLLFRLLKTQPQEAQVHFQGAISVEAKAIQLDVWSLLPLPETKEAEGVQTSSHQLSSRGSSTRLPQGPQHPPAPLYLGQLQKGDRSGCVARPMPGRVRVSLGPLATVLRVQKEIAWGTWKSPH